MKTGTELDKFAMERSRNTPQLLLILTFAEISKALYYPTLKDN